MCSEFATVVYEVANNGDSDMVGVIFLRAVVYNDSSIGNGLVSQDELNSLMVKKENGVGAGCTYLVITLCEATEFFSECSGPNLMHKAVICTFFVFVDVFPVLGLKTGLAKCSRYGM